jgi:excisionase family DNA binding protein
MRKLLLEDRLFVTVPEVAAILELDPRTVRRHIREGRIPAVKGDNSYRVPVSWLRVQAEAGEG